MVFLCLLWRFRLFLLPLKSMNAIKMWKHVALKPIRIATPVRYMTVKRINAFVQASAFPAITSARRMDGVDGWLCRQKLNHRISAVRGKIAYSNKYVRWVYFVCVNQSHFYSLRPSSSHSLGSNPARKTVRHPHNKHPVVFGSKST